jgi:hypothetical protein
MPTSLPKYSDALRRSIVDLLWRQWSALGVAGNTAQGSNAAVDPEALLLLSSVFARHDARLFDEIADWLQQNGAWINLLRMARLQREHELGDVTVLGALAEHLTQRSSHAKWKVLAKKAAPAEHPAPLFPHLPTPSRTDDIFRRWGWLRTPLESRGLSKAPRPSQPASFLLKLRALFGMQSRAEVLAWLLAHESGHPAQIARETGYFRGSVQNVLNELEMSGHVYATRDGREKHFIAPREHWRFLLTWSPSGNTAEFPRWVPWALLFTLLRRFHDLIDSPKFAGYSADLQAIELNRALKPLLDRLSGEDFLPQEFAAAGAELSVEQVLPRFQRLLSGLTE